MRKITILAMLIGSMALSVNAANGKAGGSQTYTGKTSTKSTTQTKDKDQMQTRTRERMLDQAKLDLQLRDRIQDQLRINLKDFDQTRLMIMSHSGEVTLQGIARTREEAQLMEKEVKRVQGVNRVRNNLAVEVE